MKKIIAVCLLALSLLLTGCKPSNIQPSSDIYEQQSAVPLELSSEPSSELSVEPSSEPEPETVDFTVEAGTIIEDIALNLEQMGYCTADEFIEECKKVPDIPLFSDYQPNELRPYPVEGYILSGDYSIECEKNAADILAGILENTQQTITDEMQQKAQSLGYTIDEMMTLASIIQLESKTDDAMNGVSAVFHSRLSSPDYPRLQSDMTKSYNGGTHNTYEVKGLPAGPICSVSIDAVNAALNPLDIEAYFFVYDINREYYYAKTYDEHRENIKRLQDEGIFDIW